MRRERTNVFLGGVGHNDPAINSQKDRYFFILPVCGSRCSGSCWRLRRVSGDVCVPGHGGCGGE